MEGHASISNGIVVVLDIGSSSIRVAAFKPSPDRGSAPVLIDGSLAAMPCTLNDAGEGDSLETKRCLEACIDFCLVGLRQNYQLRTSASEESPPLKVAAVCCASYAMSWLGVNSTTGHPCTPVFTYARADPGAPAAVEALRARVGSSDKRALRRLYAETGVPLHAAYAPALLYQLTAASCSNGGSGGSSSHVDSPASGVAANTVWQTIGAWVLAQWCGLASIPLSTSEASWTGLLHVHKCEWHTELATFLGLVLPPLPRTGLSDTPSLRAATNITNTSKADPASNTPNPYAGHLPPVVDYAATNLGLALAPAWAARWPELAHARLLLPVGDGACANVGTGCVDATKLACTVGTSAAVRVVLPVPPPLPLGPPLGLWCYRIDCKRVLLGGAITDGGAYVSWLRALLGLEDDVAFNEVLADAATAEDHGVSVLPFLGPERSIGWHSTATSCIAGLTRGTTQAQVLRAALDSIALRLAAIVNLLEPFLGGHSGIDRAQSSPRPNNAALWASGGALSNNPLWRQIVADATNRPVVGSKGSGIETLTGCAILAHEALSVHEMNCNGNGCGGGGVNVDNGSKRKNVAGNVLEEHDSNPIKSSRTTAETTTTTTIRATTMATSASHNGPTPPVSMTKQTIKTEREIARHETDVAWPRILRATLPDGPSSYDAMAAAQNELYESVLGPTSDFKRWYGDEHGATDS